MKEKLAKPEFVKMFLTDYEQKYVSTFADSTERITGIFCVKEAIKKAFGCPDKMDFKSMEIRHYENGKPFVIFDKSLENIVGNKVVEISLSHSITVTVGVCMVFDNDCHCGCDDECHCHEDKCDCDCDCDCQCEDCDCDEHKCECQKENCKAGEKIKKI